MFEQMPALILGVMSAASVITTTFWNQWAISSPNSSGTLGPIWAFKYLFGECIQYQTGQYQCQELQSQFLMDGYQITLRALMIISIFLATIPCVGILMGMNCTRIFEETPNLKRKIMIWSGLSYFLAGVTFSSDATGNMHRSTKQSLHVVFAAAFTFASMVWYTVRLYHEFFSTLDNFIQWEIGGCIYLGYVSSFISLMAFLACVCAPGSRQTSNLQCYPYKSATVKASINDDPTSKAPCYKKTKTVEPHRYTDYV